MKKFLIKCVSNYSKHEMSPGVKFYLRTEYKYGFKMIILQSDDWKLIEMQIASFKDTVASCGIFHVTDLVALTEMTDSGKFTVWICTKEYFAIHVDINVMQSSFFTLSKFWDVSFEIAYTLATQACSAVLSCRSFRTMLFYNWMSFS
jgi:hypothetical protein